MMFYLLSDNECDTINGGNIADGSVYVMVLTALAVLVSIYKLYTSSKGKFKYGNDYSFEWS